MHSSGINARGSIRQRASGPLRVLTVARWYPSHDSPGRGSFVADLVEATARAGVEVRVASFDRVLVRGRPDGRDATLLAARAAYEPIATPANLFVRPISFGAAGVPVARIPVVRRPGSGDPGALIEDHLAAFRPFLTRLVEDWRPDVIHAHTGLPDGIVTAATGRQLGIPVVVTEHMSTIEIELADPEALGRYRELLGTGVQLLGVSPAVAGRVAALLGVPTDRIGVLPNPVADDLFPAADQAARDPNELLWVGSIGEHKGIDVLLRAFTQVRANRPDLRLRLIGAERAHGDHARLAALAASLGVESAVSFDGWLARAQVAAAMSRACVFVHPSPSETFGVAAAEAILTGLPVAARRSGGVPWIIELSGGFGRVAAADDAASFAAAIEATLEGQLAVGPEIARSRLIDAVAPPAVASRAFAVYDAGIAGVAGVEGDAGVSGIAGQHVDDNKPELRRTTNPPPDAMPRVLVATGRDQAVGLVGALPAELQRRLVLVVPGPAATAAEDPTTGGASVVRIVEADPVPPAVPRPRGRSPLARVRRALWHPAPTADDLLARAVLATARVGRSSRGPVDVVAIDAPAAVLIGGLNTGWVRLAPGSLRWLADRWDAERPTAEP